MISETNLCGHTASPLQVRLKKSGGKSGEGLGEKRAVTTGKPALEAGSPRGFRTPVSAVRG